MEIFTPFITVNGRRIFAKEVGLKVFRFEVTEEQHKAYLEKKAKAQAKKEAKAKEKPKDDDNNNDNITE